MIREFLVPALLTVLLVGAAATDLRWRRLPNWLTLGGAGIGLTLALADGGPDRFVQHLAGWLLGAALLLPFFLMRGMGAGDVKLLAAVGAFVGPAQLLIMVFWAGVVGGVFALVLLLRQRRLVTAVMGFALAGRLPRLDQAGALTMPYGVAIAAGGLVALFLFGGGGL